MTGREPRGTTPRRSFGLARSLALGALLAAGCARDPRGDDGRLRYEGRVERDGRGGVRMAWPRTALVARFRGTNLSLRVEDDLHERATPQCDALGVEVDGGPLRRLALLPGTHEYALAQGLPPTEHAVRVTKLTEAEAGTVRVLGARLRDGAVLLAPPPAPRRRLLVIGDSISAGYGVDGPDGSCHATSATCNAARAWPSLVADALGAELHLLAWSGRGLTRNYEADEPETLPVLISRTIPTDPGSRWDDARWTPTDVVLNLGTNDVARPGFDDARYADALVALAARVQSRAPRATVLFAVGPMLHDELPTPGSRSLQRVRAATDLAVTRRLAAGFPRTARIEIPAAPPSEGRGCDEHPSAATQRRMADLVAASLRGPDDL